MRGSGNLLRASAAVRCCANIALRACFIATLLLGLAASAQDKTPSETIAADEAAESATGEAGEVQESSAETDKPKGQELEDFASETEEPFEIDPIQTDDMEEILIQGDAGTGTPKAAPISVIGFDMNTLSKEGIKDIRDLSNFTPSLEIKSQFSASNPAIFIRGVGLDDFNANSVSAVAIYQDGVYLQSGAIQLFGFFDEEVVEVLRGPQGTFYRNASAGAILVKSRAPTQEFEAYLSGTYGRFDQFDISGAISGPIVPDWLSGRVSGYWNTRDGIWKNRCGAWQSKTRPCREEIRGRLFYDPGIEDRVNNIDNYGLRAQLLLAPPTLDMEWLVNVHGGQNLGDAWQYAHQAIDVQNRHSTIDNPVPPLIGLPLLPPPRRGDSSGYRDLDGDPFAGDYDSNGPEKLDIFGTNLRYTWYFGNSYEVESLTAYEWHERFLFENTDGNPKFTLISQLGDDAWQFSEELNFRGEWIGSDLGDGGWSLGLFYLQENLDVDNLYNSRGEVSLQQTYEQDLQNFGAYIQGDYTIRPGCVPIGCDFKLDVGVRYNVEYKTFDIVSCALRDGSSCGEFDQAIDGSESELWDDWSGDFILSWLFDDAENNVYLKYSRGWKGGHFNGGATDRAAIITGVEPEVVDSYEAGLRAHWFDGRLMTNVTGFYYDYTNLQVFVLEQTPLGFNISKLLNSKYANVYGAELDLGAQPVEGMNITFNFAWVESEYTDFGIVLPFRFARPRPIGGFYPPETFLIPFDYSGNDLMASPKFSFTGSIDYEILLPGQIDGRGLGTLTPRYSFSWKDDTYFDQSSGTGAYLNFPRATFGQEAFWIHNAALSWRSENSRFEITGWVHNFLDEVYKTNSEDFHVNFRYMLHSYADPRTYGVTITLSY
jgi:iron complex outermembrane receptor protein